MNALAREDLWRKLSEAGLVSGEMPFAAESQSPWPVRAMLGIAGWIGALFLLGFASVVFRLFNNQGTALPVGAVCCIAASALFRAMHHNDFVAQFGFAVSIAGQALVLFGLLDLAGHNTSSTAFLVMGLVEAALAFAVPNYIHRVFTTFAANFCVFMAVAIHGAPALATVVAVAGVSSIWLNPVRMAERPSLWEPIGYGFVIALLHLDGSLLFGPELWKMLLPSDEPLPHFLLWLGPAVAGLVFVYAVWRLRDRAGVRSGSPGGIFAIGAAIVIALCGLAAPGISAAILVLALGFANGNRVLMGLGILAFGGYLSHFYYQLSFTLLVKSLVLAATGMALFAVRWTMDRVLTTGESTNA